MKKEPEFIGKTAKYDITNSRIIFFDEITYGIYSLNIENLFVDVIITPLRLKQCGIEYVGEVICYEGVILLIPDNYSQEWGVYEIEKDFLKTSRITDIDVGRSDVIRMDAMLYLMPARADAPVIIVDISSLKTIAVIDGWCDYSKGEKLIGIWGSTATEDSIFFPLIGTNRLYKITGMEISYIELEDIDDIYTCCVETDYIWNVSESGVLSKHDFDGALVLKTNTCDILEKNKKGAQYLRILSFNNMLILLPNQHNPILLYKKNTKEIITIEKYGSSFRQLYIKNYDVPYWGFVRRNNNVFLLPNRFRFTEIDLENGSITERRLCIGKNFSDEEYHSWIYGKVLYEENVFSLKSFIEEISEDEKRLL